MNKTNQRIETQYVCTNLYKDIVVRLEEQNIDLNQVTRAHIAGVDEFHVRGVQVTKELVQEIDFQNLNVLDVGCGLGGPARMLADEFNCTVSGIDMSHDFIDAAQKLSALVKTNGSTEFVQGDALDLPYSDNCFDVVWTQHVQMNIEDKTKFYQEIDRVLKPGGSFIYYDIFRIGDNNINFPVPWADRDEVSFLGTKHNMDSILTKLGFTKTQTKDQTKKGATFFRGMLEKIKLSGPPKLGLNVLMGASTKDKIGNILNGLETGKIELESGVYKK